MPLINSISGIRGTIGGVPGDSLTPIDIVKYSAAFGAFIKESTHQARIVIGRDGRNSGPLLNQLVSSTLQSLGMDVIDLGLATTPTVEIAVPLEKAGGGIVLTASHNPKNWNALKLLNQRGEFISDLEGKRVLEIAKANKMEFANFNGLGKYILTDKYLQKHIDLIMRLPLVEPKIIKSRNFKVVVDCINSVGGIFVPFLLKSLGVTDITLLNGEPDGNFAHNPEPLAENLLDLSNKVKKTKADLGIAVDPDVDRLVFVNEDGSMFGEEYTLVAVADYVLQHRKGNTVSNLSSTRALKDITQKFGYSYYPAAVGEVNVVSVMKLNKAVIGGEGNGGVIYPDLHYGRDALVGIALFLSYLAKSGMTASSLRAKYPNYFISKNKIELTPATDVDNILERVKKKYKKYPLNTEDGVRIEFDNEWVHLRKSNTEPIIRIYAESSSVTTAEHLANKIIADIKEIIHN